MLPRLLLAFLTAGCTPPPCTGPECAADYGASRLDILPGQDFRYGPDDDPLEASVFSWSGGVELGVGWSLATARGNLAVGMPEAGQAVVLSGSDLLGGLFTPLQFREGEATAAFGASVALATVLQPSVDALLVGAPRGTGHAGAVEGGTVAVFVPGTTAAVFTILGNTDYDHAGSLLAPCGDQDGDGLEEIAVVAPWDQGAAPLAGAVTLVRSTALARARAEGDSAALADLGPTFASRTVGAGTGASLACRQDLTGDGVADLVVGVPFADGPDGRDAAGAVFVVDGLDDGGGILEEVAVAAVYAPEAEQYLGGSVAVGDLDRTGHPGILAGAVGGGDAQEGQVLWFADPLGGAESPSRTFLGEDGDDRFGATTGLADMDGDGFLDLLSGAPGHTPGNDSRFYGSGALYVWYGEGGSTSTGSTVRAAGADGILRRSQGYLSTGNTLEAADLDGDDRADLVLVFRTDG